MCFGDVGIALNMKNFAYRKLYAWWPLTQFIKRKCILFSPEILIFLTIYYDATCKQSDCDKFYKTVVNL